MAPNSKPAGPPSGAFSFPKQEEEILKYWKEIDAFQESLRQNQGKPAYTFYDGPPFATGLPHHGHVLIGTVKDVVTRYAHSNGYSVERRFGWDTHGLPVEHEINKKLGITSKADVLALGIDKYNAECRAIIMRYSNEWRKTVERLGRWIDFDNNYKTLDTPYMESVWWVFSELWKKKLVYKGMRVMPYSTGLTTPLSNFEATEEYRDVHDPAITVSFPLTEDPSVSLLAWTTTPWTLPSNLALCVNPDFTYLKIHDTVKDAIYILCEDRLSALYKNPQAALDEGKYKVIEKFLGKDMVGWEYIPVFDCYVEQYAKRAFKVLADEYVTSDTGTGIVHQAPAFGEDDHRIAIKEGIVQVGEIPPCPIDEKGIFTREAGEFLEGLYIKDADKVIIDDLKGRGRLISSSTLIHSYPHCPRSDTPLIYRVIPSWFVKVTDSIDKLLINNKGTRWVPAAVGENRFQNWISNARDWNVSRNRYWGTPLPIWTSDDGEEVVCIGSIQELNELSGCGILPDLHRDKIDDITIPSKMGKGVLRRVEEVFDCWFESGSMPYAQLHYPFENKEKFEASFPADFISEGMDQTRCWFYVLLVLSTHLFDTAPWKNLIVCGLVLAADGKKMSKRLKNYPDPTEIIDRHGADALRLYLINSPVVRGDTLKFKESDVKGVVTRVLLPMINALQFFEAQVALLKKTHGITFVYNPAAPQSTNVMDRWILARCQSLIRSVKEEMEAYRLYTVVARILAMVDDLTDWYIRINRPRLKGSISVEDTVAGLQTLFETLFTLSRSVSPFVPFLTEHIYQQLREFIPKDATAMNLGADTRSIHFLPFPSVRLEYFDPAIELRVDRFQKIIELGRVIRERKAIPVKYPLKELIIYHRSTECLEDIHSLESYVCQELNVHSVTFTSDEKLCGIKYKAEADMKVLGQKLRGNIGKVKAGLQNLTSDQVKTYLASGTIEIAGIKLVEGDLNVTPQVGLTPPENATAPHYESNTDNNMVVLLDILIRPELEEEYLARQICNRIQRLRKKAGLKATDDIDVFYTVVAGDGATLEESLRTQEKLLMNNLKVLPRRDDERNKEQSILMEEEQDIGGIKVIMRLVASVAR